MLGKAALVAALAYSADALLLKQPKLGAQDGDFVGNTADRNAMYDCSGGAVAAGTKGASNSMAMRTIAAKAAAIAGDTPPKSMADFNSKTKKVNKFHRHAAQDFEDGPDGKKNDMNNNAPYAARKNFSGPNTDVSAANAATDKALEKAVGIRQKYLGQQFAGVSLD